MQKQTFRWRTLLFAPTARLYASLPRGFCDTLQSRRMFAAAPSRTRIQGVWSLEKKHADPGTITELHRDTLMKRSRPQARPHEKHNIAKPSRTTRRRSKQKPENAMEDTQTLMVCIISISISIHSLRP